MLPYDEISRAITVRHLMTPMDDAIGVAASDSAGAAAKVLRSKDFDQAPVMNAEKVIGFVITADLLKADPHSPVAVQPLSASFLVNAEAPVGTALIRLQSVPMLFVVEEMGLAGLVTPSDLNKHPARTHFYLLLADLEMTMAAKARAHYTDPDNALTLLSPERRQAVTNRHRADKAFNLDADVLTAFEFADLLTAMKKTGIHRRFGIDSPSVWKSTMWPLSDFRNDVMHPTNEFLGSRTVGDLVRIEQTLRRVLIASSQAGGP